MSTENKVLDPFQQAISDHINNIAGNDLAFRKRVELDSKSIEDCATYVMNQVKASGRNGFADAEIYGMINHYYDEDDIEVGGKINAKVIVNKSIELTPEEIVQAKQKAIDDKIAEEKQALIEAEQKEAKKKADALERKKAKAEKLASESGSLTLFG